MKHFIVFLASLMATNLGLSTFAAEATRILIVVGPTNHPPGTHEVAAGGRLMEHCLENMANLPNVQADIVYEWPEKSLQDSADSVVFIGDTFPPNRLPNASQNLADLDAMMRRGCGIVCVHYATGLLGEDVKPNGDHPLLGWMGGYFANRSCPHHESYAKIFPEATIKPAAPQHPIWRGCKEFTVNDEPYINNYFGGQDNKPLANVTPLATSMLPPEMPKPETVSWCIERPDAGRGFAVVMPHFYRNWKNEDLRRYIINGIVWSAKLEVPQTGVQTSLPELNTFQPAAVEPQPRPAKSKPKPNIVVIVADDLGYADVHFNPLHPSEVLTPHLSALAKESVICRQGYVTGHVCSPTRAGLMTGRYQQRLGLYTGGEAGSGLPLSESIFPQFLKSSGYVSCQLGKWHLGPTPEWSPALRGFDEVFGFLGRGAHDYFKLNDPDDPIYRGTTQTQESGYLTDRLGEEAVAFIDRHKSNPFLLYLAFNAVHAPLQAPEDEIAKFNTGNTDRNVLLAMGKRMDDAIGSLVAKLKQEKIWENTLLFFISDNGGPLAQSANNAPLRGGKHQDYEGGIRIPFLVCWPDRLPPGESQAVVSSLDILPTALAAAGVPLPTDKPLDGINLIPLLRGDEKPTPRNLFWCAGGTEVWWAVRSGDWKLVGEQERVGLFDLSQDVSEANDLSKAMPDKVKELTHLHDKWLAEMAEPVKGGGKRYSAADGTTKKKKKNKKAAK